MARSFGGLDALTFSKNSFDVRFCNRVIVTEHQVQFAVANHWIPTTSNHTMRPSVPYFGGIAAAQSFAQNALLGDSQRELGGGS